MIDLQPGAAQRLLDQGTAACLIWGPVGSGRRGVARRAATCHLGAADGRPDPDLCLLEGVDGKPANAEAARKFVGAMHYSGERGRRAGIVPDADGLNAHAAGALLKLVEEPPVGTRLFLTAAHPGSIPPALLSRCTRLRIDRPAPDLADAWFAERANDLSDSRRAALLSLADGLPGQALSWRDKQIEEAYQHACKLLAPIARGRGAPGADLIEPAALRDADLVLDMLIRLLQRAAALDPTTDTPVIDGEDKLIAALQNRPGLPALASTWRRVLAITRGARDNHLDPARTLYRAADALTPAPA